MFHRFLKPHTESVYAVLRIVVGLLFAFHGWQGLTGMLIPPEYKVHMWSQGWFGSVIELVTGVLMAVGFYLPCAAFLASGTMAVAYVQYHWKFAFDAQFFPSANQGELSLVFAFLFLYMACRGAGKWSVDAARK